MSKNIDLQKLIKDAAKNAFLELRQSNPSENFCAFGLYSDESAMTVCPSANTQKYLEEKIKKDSDDPPYYKWSTAEWKYEFSGHEWFDSVEKFVKKIYQTINTDEDFSKFQEVIFESCISALEELRAEGFFKNCIVVFSVSDYLDDQKEISWAYRLNDAAEASEFEEWINNQE